MYKQEKVDINCLCTFVRFNRVRMERKVFAINVAEFIYNLQTNQSGRKIAVNSYSVDANMDKFIDVHYSLCQPVPAHHLHSRVRSTALSASCRSQALLPIAQIRGEGYTISSLSTASNHSRMRSHLIFRCSKAMLTHDWCHCSVQ